MNNELPTYGEVLLIQKDSMRLNRGQWTTCELPKHREFKTKDEAMGYYCKKLDRYWLTAIDQSVINRLGEKRALEILKGRNIL